MKRLAILFALLFSCIVPGYAQNPAGTDAKLPLSFTVKDADGKAIGDTNVSIVLLPTGGIEELKKAVDHNWPLNGWYYKTDKSGHLSLTQIPKDDPHIDRDAVAVAVSEAITSSEASDTDEAQSLKYDEHEDGDQLGIVIDAPGRDPWIGTIKPDSEHETVHLETIQGKPGAYVGMDFSVTPTTSSHTKAATSLTDHGAPASDSVYVHGYLKKDGTYVAAHYRSKPDGNFYNNWSTKGNYNPYTGKKGTKTTKSSSSSRSRGKH